MGENSSNHEEIEAFLRERKGDATAAELQMKFEISYLEARDALERFQSENPDFAALEKDDVDEEEDANDQDFDEECERFRLNKITNEDVEAIDKCGNRRIFMELHGRYCDLKESRHGLLEEIKRYKERSNSNDSASGALFYLSKKLTSLEIELVSVRDKIVDLLESSKKKCADKQKRLAERKQALEARIKVLEESIKELEELELADKKDRACRDRQLSNLKSRRLRLKTQLLGIEVGNDIDEDDDIEDDDIDEDDIDWGDDFGACLEEFKEEIGDEGEYEDEDDFDAESDDDDDEDAAASCLSIAERLAQSMKKREAKKGGDSGEADDGSKDGASENKGSSGQSFIEEIRELVKTTMEQRAIDANLKVWEASEDGSFGASGEPPLTEVPKLKLRFDDKGNAYIDALKGCFDTDKRPGGCVIDVGFEFPNGSPYQIRLVNTSRGYMLTDGGCAMRYLGANRNFDNADIVREVKRICAGFGMAIRKSQLFFPVSEGVGIVKSLMMFVAAIGRLADVANQNVIAAASEEMLWACAYEFRELLLKNRRDSRKELIKIIKDIVSQAKKKKDYRKILIFLCLKDGLEQITDSYYDQIKKQQLNLFCDD